MNHLVLIIAMLFCHIVDDFYLQGWLTSAKQKKWWDDHASQYMYRHDYKVALIEHALSWSIMIHIPVLISLYIHDIWDDSLIISIGVSLLGNLIIHAIVDNLKANAKLISLVEDQFFHFVQIIITFAYYVYLISSIIQ